MATPLGRLGGDVVKVRRRPPDDRAEADDAVILAAEGQFLGDDRYLPGSGDLVNFNIVLVGPGPDQGVQGAATGAR